MLSGDETNANVFGVSCCWSGHRHTDADTSGLDCVYNVLFRSRETQGEPEKIRRIYIPTGVPLVDKRCLNLFFQEA